MDLEKIVSEFQNKAGNTSPVGARLKFVLDGQSVLIDGTGEKNLVSLEDGEADCTITTSLDTLMSIQKGDTNPMMAVMSGKVKIQGDMGLAMKLQSLLG